MKKNLPAKPRKKKERQVIGWRELVGLPDLGIPALRVKIDTGARTSALHAVDLIEFERDGARWIEFHVPQPGKPRSERCSARLVDKRPIKNTSGVPEHRYVIETTLVFGPRHWRMEVSLADREKMEFDLILGRTAIRRRKLLVDPGRSFLAGSPYEQALEQPTSEKDTSREGPRPRKTSRQTAFKQGARQ